MHKGYTLNYFINFFKNIPDHQWCTHRMQSEGTIQHCAMGHAIRDPRTTYRKTTNVNFSRSRALGAFLAMDASIANINDNTAGRFTKLGKTPRGRILKALRNRKRYGNIFGKQ